MFRKAAHKGPEIGVLMTQEQFTIQYSGWLGHVRQRQDGFWEPCAKPEAQAWIAPKCVQQFLSGAETPAHLKFPPVCPLPGIDYVPESPLVRTIRDHRLPGAVVDKLSQADLDAIHAFVATGYFTSHGDLMTLMGKLLAAYEDRE